MCECLVYHDERVGTSWFVCEACVPEPDCCDAPDLLPVRFADMKAEIAALNDEVGRLKRQLCEYADGAEMLPDPLNAKDAKIKALKAVNDNLGAENHTLRLSIEGCPICHHSLAEWRKVQPFGNSEQLPAQRPGEG